MGSNHWTHRAQLFPSQEMFSHAISQEYQAVRYAGTPSMALYCLIIISDSRAAHYNNGIVAIGSQDTQVLSTGLTFININSHQISDEPFEM